MMAKCIPSILPNLSIEEAFEVTKIYSVAGLIEKDTPIISKRTYRAPHHTISGVSLVGGGRTPKPGEISLAHNGVLFLDELTEFNKHTLELMRGPLEDKQVSISRINGNFTYPCNFMLVASMNPCPCGYYGSKDRKCTCTKNQIDKYMNKISGPLLDRIDIHIEAEKVEYKNLENEEDEETSEAIRQRVNKARKIAYERYREYGIYSNAELTPELIKKYCKLDKNTSKILEEAFQKLGFSARAYSRILKLARTIADLDEKENIELKHITEAIRYRDLDRKYWKN